MSIMTESSSKSHRPDISVKSLQLLMAAAILLRCSTLYECSLCCIHMKKNIFLVKRTTTVSVCHPPPTKVANNTRNKPASSKKKKKMKKNFVSLTCSKRHVCMMMVQLGCWG